MAKKKTTLPKNFRELIEERNIDNLIKVFETCEVDATDGYSKSTALSFFKVPDELIRWLIQNGADMEASDIYGRTALHNKASARSGDVAVLLELGANVNARDQSGDTPLHFAAAHGFNVTITKDLIKYGANREALNNRKKTPLECALQQAQNMVITELVKISNILLQPNSIITPEMKGFVTRIGENFEFHRENFNKDFLQVTEDALTELYTLFSVAAVKRRIVHDGISPIILTETTWQKQYSELWELLIPSSGSAKTVQGEVIRIAGKVRDEINRNGSGNWNADFKKMLDALLKHLSSGNSIGIDLEKTAEVIKPIQKSGSSEEQALDFLCEMATKWVSNNPLPILLEKPNYKR